MKLARALNAASNARDTLVMRRSLDGDEDQGADRTRKVGIRIIRVPYETADLKMLTVVRSGPNSKASLPPGGCRPPDPRS